jgi:hypothetical protein
MSSLGEEGEQAEVQEEKYLYLSSSPLFIASAFQWIENSLLHQHSLIDLSIVSDTPHRRNVTDSFYYHFSLGFQPLFLYYIQTLSTEQLQRNPSLSSLILFELKNLEVSIENYDLLTLEAVERIINTSIDHYDGKVRKLSLLLILFLIFFVLLLFHSCFIPTVSVALFLRFFSTIS